MSFFTEFFTMLKTNHVFFISTSLRYVGIESKKFVKIFKYIPWPKAWCASLSHTTLYYYSLDDLFRYPFAYLHFMYLSIGDWYLKYRSENN